MKYGPLGVFAAAAAAMLVSAAANAECAFMHWPQMSRAEKATAADRLGIKSDQLDALMAAAKAERIDPCVAEETFRRVLEFDTAAARTMQQFLSEGMAPKEAHKATVRSLTDYRDPGAVDLCPPPHRLTNNGCQPGGR